MLFFKFVQIFLQFSELKLQFTYFLLSLLVCLILLLSLSFACFFLFVKSIWDLPVPTKLLIFLIRIISTWVLFQLLHNYVYFRGYHYLELFSFYDLSFLLICFFQQSLWTQKDIKYLRNSLFLQNYKCCNTIHDWDFCHKRSQEDTA